MVGRSEGFFVLYPVYFEASATRAKGRRVSDASAVKGATAKGVFEAARAAGLEPVLEDEHHHPTAWFERTGRVLIPTSAAKTKTDAIALVAEQLAGAQEQVGPRPVSSEKKGARKHHKHKKGRRHR